MATERRHRGWNRSGGSAARALLLLLALGVVSGCASSSNRGLDRAVLQPERDPGQEPLQPGDALRLTFSREPGLNGQYAVDETGSAVLPLLGSWTVTGKPAAQVKTELTAEYAARTRNQSVQVVYLRRVRVLGEVRSPGLYHVDPTMTVDDALALAGGATSDGNLENVSLMRDGVEVAEGLDVRRSVEASIESGDQIYVPKTSWFSRYGGVVVGASITALGAIIAFGR